MNATQRLIEAANAVIDAQPNSGPQWYMEDEIKSLVEATRLASTETPTSIFMDDVEWMRSLYARGNITRAEQLRDDLAKRLDDIMKY